MVPEQRPWFSEEEVHYYADYLSGASPESQRNFRTLIATVAEVIGETELDALLKKLVAHAIRTTGAERGLLLLPRDGQLAIRVALDSQGDSLGRDLEYSHSIPESVVRENKPVIAQVSGTQQTLGLSESVTGLRLRELMCAPLRARGRVLGAVYVDSKVTRRTHTDADLMLFHAQAGLMGLAIENHRLFHEAWEAQDLQRQLLTAREIQLRLLPRSPAKIGGVELVALNLIAAQVGGDYCDYVPLERDRLALAIGDVSGHGVAPALMMSDVRGHLRSALLTKDSLAGVHDALNEVLREELTDGMYVALFVGIFDAKTRTLEYRNAGHVAPLHYSLRADRFEALERTAPVLGLFAGGPGRACRSLPIGPGDLLVCYTDGVVDRPDPEGEHYGIGRLREAVRTAARAGADAIAVADAIRADSEAYAAGRGLRDDFTLLLARF